MKIGSMNVPLLLQAQSLVDDGEGGQIAQWATLAALWGKIERTFDGSSVTADQNRITHKITVRRREDVAFAPAQRLSYEEAEKFYMIHRVELDAKDKGYLALGVGEVGYVN